MKRFLSIIMTCVLVYGLIGCGSAKTAGEDPSSDSERTAASSAESRQPGERKSQEASGAEDVGADNSEPEKIGTKALVVYFSTTGNTKSVAEALAKMQDADLYEIVPEQPYTDEDLNYNDSSSRATAEQNDENARPAISGGIDHMDDYDVVYVGFPIWWGDMPRILLTFFDTYDFSGKMIVPFCTSGSSGISQAVSSIGELEPSATVAEGLRASTSNPEEELTKWLTEIGLAK
ncbi:flavodoxin [Cuneatibacter sp. NSJ-177]|uniref:flavodoxin n=1 Tax=Cuneatibacter sp. NSJ-177 TaxID=2931401 RepID=UPI001FD113B4|nr:flavodoxin [Cuneatibacter sp. NSJ-177]MCJ7835190.1 flavodoxin [Cuneatibacter sp. NSJ-177]